MMIWRPKPGQRVEIRYARKQMPYHGRRGTIVVAGRGPGPINAMVDVGDAKIVVPRGNLFAVKE